MAQYYFLVSLLPQLAIGQMPAIGFSELKELFKINVSREDMKKVRSFLRMIDFENLRSLWTHEKHDPRGNLSLEELKAAVQNQEWTLFEEFPAYLRAFLDKHKTDPERAAHFHLLMSRFLEEGIDNETGFLQEYFAFEKSLRLVIVGFRAKKLKKNVEVELQYEDSKDPLIAQIIAQKDAKSYEPPHEFKELRSIFERYADKPMELNKALTEYRFNEIQGMVGSGGFFSIDRILNYMARLLLCERWLELDLQTGIKIVDAIERKIT